MGTLCVWAHLSLQLAQNNPQIVSVAGVHFITMADTVIFPEIAVKIEEEEEVPRGHA
jgi:NO-binding membrane sensor protein with MHYT domain